MGLVWADLSQPRPPTASVPCILQAVIKKLEVEWSASSSLGTRLGMAQNESMPGTGMSLCVYMEEPGNEVSNDIGMRLVITGMRHMNDNGNEAITCIMWIAIYACSLNSRIHSNSPYMAIHLKTIQLGGLPGKQTPVLLARRSNAVCLACRTPSVFASRQSMSQQMQLGSPAQCQVGCQWGGRSGAFRK